MLNHTTLSRFDLALLTRLGSGVEHYWPESERLLLIEEALLTYGAISQFFKDRIIINTVVNKNVYDFYTDLNGSNKEKIGNNKTYQYIIDLINVYLMESLSDVNSISDLYDVSYIYRYINRRLDLFLKQTGLYVDVKEYRINASESEIDIDTNILDIIRVNYRSDIDNIKVRLYREDEGSLEFYDYNFNVDSHNPSYYSTSLKSNSVLRIYNRPLNAGWIEILYNSSNDLITETSDTVIKLFDNLVPYVAKGVIADLLLEDGNAQDLARANYCLERWNEGVFIGKLYNTILKCYINEESVYIDALDNADSYDYNWMNNVGKPDCLLIANSNLFYTNKKPDDIYSIALDCVINAPFSLDPNSFIEIPEDDINVLLDYIIHLLKFKEGFSQIQNTYKYYEAFLQTCINRNSNLIRQGISLQTLMKRTKIQQTQSKVLI
jgi:hypothetical protein